MTRKPRPASRVVSASTACRPPADRRPGRAPPRERPCTPSVPVRPGGAVVIQPRSASNGTSPSRGHARVACSAGSPARLGAERPSSAASRVSPAAPHPSPSARLDEAGVVAQDGVAQQLGSSAGPARRPRRPPPPRAGRSRCRSRRRGAAGRHPDRPGHHPPLGQRAGLVRGEDGHRAEGLDRGQVPHQRECRCAIRCAPRASEIVTTAGRDSGTAATARLTASDGSAPPRRGPARARRHPARTSAQTTRSRDSLRSRRCRGVSRTPGGADRPAILPSPLSAPVRTPSPRPAPGRDRAGEHLLAHPAVDRLGLPGHRRLVDAEGGRLRPGTSGPPARCRRRRAAPGPPAPPRPRAPRAVGRPGPPSATGAVSWSSSTIASSARISWVTPTVVFTTTTSAMTAASAASPITTVTTQAASSSRIIGSRSWDTTRETMLLRLGPGRAVRSGRLQPTRRFEAGQPGPHAHIAGDHVRETPPCTASS